MTTYIGNTRYKAMVGGERASLISSLITKPYDAEIEYLESSGTQWIDTGIIPDSNTIVQFKFVNLYRTDDVIIGYFINDTNDWRLFNHENACYFDTPNSGRIADGNIYENTLYELELGNYYVKNLDTGINIVSGNATSYTGISTITLNNYNNVSFSKNRWYYVKIYSGSVLVRDMIPVRIGQIGYMYDKVSKQLFSNAGTGEFILGPDV